ncbi:MAG: DUF983 domain-containing protein [Hyphomicrobiaceae bacterium]|jgi:uncharacterized protein (DUF983 family)
MSATVRAGLIGRCPRCGTGPLFTGPLSLAIRDRCPRCDLDFKFVDPGDGPAIFAIMILGFVILGAALIVEFRFNPPLWVHIALWVPVTLVVGFVLLRPLKSMLIALQYHHKAEEGRLGGK